MKNKNIPTIVLAVVVLLMLVYPPIARVMATNDVPKIGTPPQVCSNIASKVDKRIDKDVLYSGTFSMDVWNPCTEVKDTGVKYDVCEGWRICRYKYPDGTLSGSIYNGYMGGEVTRFTMCSDGRAEVVIKPIGYWWSPVTKTICSTM